MTCEIGSVNYDGYSIWLLLITFEHKWYEVSASKKYKIQSNSEMHMSATVRKKSNEIT